MARLTVFLSIATAEASKTDPGHLKAGLEKMGWHVLIQSGFSQSPRSTILALDDAIHEETDAVVHIIGSEAGSVANPIAVEAFFEREDKDTFLIGSRESRKIRDQLDDFTSLTYTQWEAFLALHRNIPLFIYTPMEGTDSFPQTQLDHLARFRKASRHPSGYNDDAELIQEVLQDLGKLQQRKPTTSKGHIGVLASESPPVSLDSPTSIQSSPGRRIVRFGYIAVIGGLLSVAPSQHSMVQETSNESLGIKTKFLSPNESIITSGRLIPNWEKFNPALAYLESTTNSQMNMSMFYLIMKSSRHIYPSLQVKEQINRRQSSLEITEDVSDVYYFYSEEIFLSGDSVIPVVTYPPNTNPQITFGLWAEGRFRGFMHITSDEVLGNLPLQTVRSESPVILVAWVFPMQQHELTVFRDHPFQCTLRFKK